MDFGDCKDLVYGDIGGAMLFFPRTRAEAFAAFCKARAQAKTWGEFRRLTPTALLDEVPDYDEDDEPHGDNAPFNKEDTLSIWWPFPESDQIKFLPEDVVALGSFSDTGEGDRVDFSIAQEDEIVAKLRGHGYTVERNDGLVLSAMDY